MHFKGRGNETYTKYQCCVAEIMCIFPKSSKYRCAILKITTDPPIHQIKFSANFSCHNYGMYVLNMGYRNFISPTCTYVVVWEWRLNSCCTYVHIVQKVKVEPLLHVCTYVQKLKVEPLLHVHMYVHTYKHTNVL